MFPKSGGLARYSKPATANLGSFRKLRWLIPPLCAGDKEGWRGAHCWQVAEVRIMSGRVWTQLATSGSRLPAAERGRGVQLSNLSWCKVEKCNYKKWEPVCRVKKQPLFCKWRSIGKFTFIVKRQICRQLHIIYPSSSYFPFHNHHQLAAGGGWRIIHSPPCNRSSHPSRAKTPVLMSTDGDAARQRPHILYQ